MARQVLENGVILPAEYSDDWYDDMTSNLTKLDDVIGSDSEKLSSADVGAAALSNSYNDLDNLPTIPTVNDATLTIQKNGVDVQTFTANASSNVTANISVPTKTSDLTNDSNFVDTSNSAVSSGITSAKVSDYDTHIADTDIHVTTTDKNRWNNQTYVFRYSSTALTASSTNSNTLLDNTDNLKVGDKVIDSSGVLFSITAIDTANSTFTIGTALIDLAQDSDVVHKSGNETINGNKTFLDVPISFKSSTAELGVTGGSTKVIFTDKNLLNLAGITFGNYGSSKLSYCRFHIYDKDSNNQEIENFIEFSYVNNNRVAYFRPNKSNFVTLGTVNNRWNKVYADEYCYGSNNVEFSTKFVTTDTNQTISGNKTFSSINGVEPSSLSLPDLDNGIDISSYLTAGNSNNTYTPSANGWISISIGASSGGLAIFLEQGDMKVSSYSVTGKYQDTDLSCFACLPVVAGVVVNIGLKGNSNYIKSAKFIPCRGNV